MTNRETVRAFIRGVDESGGSGNLTFRNGELFSYAEKIAAWVNGKLVVYDKRRRFSATTSRHVGLILPHADSVERP